MKKTPTSRRHFPPLFGVFAGLLIAVACSPVTAGQPLTTKASPSSVSDASGVPPLSIDPPVEAVPPVTPPQPLKITVTEAVLRCLENNRTLVVQRLNPVIERTFEAQAQAAFDATIGAEFSAGREEGESLARSGSETEAFTEDTAEAVISLEKYFPTGTTVAVEAGTETEDSSLYDSIFYSTRLGVTLTQSLLKGFGRNANLVQLRQAQLDTRISEYELRGFTETLVAEVEKTYWDYALSRRQIEIVEQSLKVARQQLDETRELIEVGRLARSEMAAVQAEVASQEQALIEARANEAVLQLQLLRLINPAGPNMWEREIELVHPPAMPEIQLQGVALHAAMARRMRPILNQARLEIEHGRLELVKTSNGLLPLLDVFITLGKSGYADSFGRSVNDMDGQSYDALAGMRFQFPLANRDAKSRHRRAALTHEQARYALDNLLHLVELDVRNAYIQVNRTRQQIGASSATRQYDEEKLRTETEKLRVGKSTSFLVAQAQRDLLTSRIAEVQALVNYIEALTNLYQQDGSLLVRRGIAAPGNLPVE